MTEQLHSLAYMHVKGSAQGAFLDDKSRAGKGKTLCLSVKFRGEVPHDIRGGQSHAVTKHDPISVVREWGPSTAQFLTALWNNEILDEVGFEFVRQSAAGKEEVYATLTLKKATVAYVETHAGDAKHLLSEGWRSVDVIGLHFEKIEFKFTDGSGQATASYDRSKS